MLPVADFGQTLVQVHGLQFGGAVRPAICRHCAPPAIAKLAQRLHHHPRHQAGASRRHRPTQQPQRREKMVAAVGVAGQLEQGLALVPLPARAALVVDQQPAAMRQGLGLGDEAQHLLVREALQGLQCAALQVLQRLGCVVRLRPVVCQQLQVRGQVVAEGLLEPAGDRPVHLAPLGKAHQVVGHLLGDDLREQVREIGLGLVQPRQVDACQVVQVAMQC